jgi:hypothetical protein
MLLLCSIERQLQLQINIHAKLAKFASLIQVQTWTHNQITSSGTVQVIY